MKKRCTLILAALLIALVVPSVASAGLYCTTYYDSRAASSWGDSYCWLSGAICYQCWDDFANDCSSDWHECSPVPTEEHQTARLLLDDAQDHTIVSICQEVPEAAELDPEKLL